MQQARRASSSANGRTQLHRRAVICKFFAQGMCQYGDKCRFLHTAAPAEQKPSPHSQVKSPQKTWKGKQVTKRSYVNEDGVLDPLDAAHFCAAGALLWHAEDDELHMVLAVEERKPGQASSQLERRYNFLGGKRDFEAEAPSMVAAREVWEETGEQLSRAARQRIEQGPHPVAWVPASKYALFCVRLGIEDANLVERVAALGRRPDPIHDVNLHGVARDAQLLDRDWCKRNF